MYYYTEYSTVKYLEVTVYSTGYSNTGPWPSMRSTDTDGAPAGVSLTLFSSIFPLLGGGGGGWARLLLSVCVFGLGFGEGGGPFLVRQLHAKASPSFSQI